MTAMVAAGCGSGPGTLPQVPNTEQLFEVPIRGGAIRQLTSGGAGQAQPTWSPNGRLIASSTQANARSRIEVRRINGSLVRAFSAGGDPVDAAAWSPDGRRLAFPFVRPTTEGATARLRIVDLHGRSRELRQRVIGRPAWSSDGRRLAFTRGNVVDEVQAGGPEPTTDLALVPAVGGKARVLARSIGDVDFDPLWSPVGRSVLYSRADKGGTKSIRMVAPATGTDRRLVGGLLDTLPAWSPDGRRIAVTANTLRGDRSAHLYLLSARGGRLRRLARLVTGGPTWSPDGERIAFPDGDRIRVLRLRTRATRTLVRFRGADISDLDWSPDGKRLLFVAGPPPEES